MIVKWLWVLSAVFFSIPMEGNGEMDNIIKAIDKCACVEVEFCMSKYIFKALREVSGKPKIEILDGFLELKRTEENNGTEQSISDSQMDSVFEGRSAQEKQTAVQSLIEDTIWDFLKSRKLILRIPESARDQTLFRTYTKFRRFFYPLLIGVMLKLAAFVPFSLGILGILAKGAFFSGNAAIFLSGLTVFLRYFYPKSWEFHHPPHYYKHDTTGHDIHTGTGSEYAAYPQPHHHHHHSYRHAYRR